MIKKMRILSCLVLVLALTSCFKNEPKKEMMRMAGAWKITKAELTTYASDGTVSSSTETSDLGVLMLNHNDDFLYQGTFSLSYNPSWTAWNSPMTAAFNASNSWFVNVGATRFSLGEIDYSTGYMQTVAGYTIEKLTNKKGVIFNVVVNPDGSIFQREKWYLKRP
jgi:hypothetical protein